MKPSKIFSVTIGDPRFHPSSFSNSGLLAILRRLKGLEYTFECRGPRNSYQLNSSFDESMRQRLLASGGREFSFKPACPTSIDFDFALDLQGHRVVFEIEKTNKEKLLYDFLKMHMYLHSDIAAAVLVAPINWSHSGGVEDLFSLAQERFDLCNAYGMADASKTQRMLIVGVTQLYRGRPIDNSTLRLMKQECEVYFRA
jgi:hypothetical protein